MSEVRSKAFNRRVRKVAAKFAKILRVLWGPFAFFAVKSFLLCSYKNEWEGNC